MLFKIAPTSLEGQTLIVGKSGTPNQLTQRNTKRLLPFQRLKIGESVYINPKEMLKSEVDKALLSVRTVNNFNCLPNEKMLAVVKTDSFIEIVRIR